MPGRPCRWAACLLIGLALSGCWDRREIEERNTVLAVGADRCEAPPPCGLVITRQIVIPRRVPMGGRTLRGGSKNTVDVLVNDGKDDIDASGKAQAELHRDMHFGHIRIFVMGEALARQGLKEYLHWVHSLPEQGYLEWFAVAEGKAGDLMKARPRLEPVPSLFLYHLLSDAQRAGRIQRMYLSDLQITLANGGEDATVPLLAMAGPDRPRLAGLAVFAGATMVGKLTSDEMVTFQQLRGAPRGSEMIRTVLPGGHPVTVRVGERQVHYQVRSLETGIAVAIHLRLETDLQMLGHALSSKDPRVIRLIEQQVAAQVQSQAQALVHKLQHDLQSDALAIGQRVRAFLPGEWAAIKDWRAAYRNVSIQVQAEVQVRRTGLAAQ
ncbi:MAG TPA: Ger(x)C family spore germination protein [Symbiobacteriaceae bacterium]|nr:Ger(x)C family spore germination protein [Symbiobacteriaceae bacterium]